MDNCKQYKRLYWPNGKMLYEASYVGGILHGIEKRYYQNGQLNWEFPFVNGKLHGVAKWYFETGQLRAVVPYVNGKRYGIERWYDYDGQLICEMSFVNNLACGIEKKYRNGKLVKKTYYWHGKKITKEQWDNIPRLVKVLNGISADSGAVIRTVT